MDEIPADIRAAAAAVVERGYDEGLLDAVARAIMAERERCAKVADRRAEVLSKIRGYHSEVTELRTTAAAIRNPAP